MIKYLSPKISPQFSSENCPENSHVVFGDNADSALNSSVVYP